MTHRKRLFAILASLPLASTWAQSPAFEVASVKPVKAVSSRGDRSVITTDPGRFTGRNVTLKTLIYEAYQLQYFQIAGAPNWADSEEYSVDAKAEHAATRDEMRLMLRALLADRFKLVLRRDSREMKAYILTTAKGGAKLHPVGSTVQETPPPGPGIQRFRGGLAEFANVLSVKLTIPVAADPTRPSMATGAVVPVVDRTGLKGEYEINVGVNFDSGGDAFTAWQQALQEQLGLKLESQKVPVDIYVIEHAERVLPGN